MSIRVKFRWTDVKQKEFKNIKQILDYNNLLDYPDFNKQVDIHTDYRYIQLGVIISQKGKPVALYNK